MLLNYIGKLSKKNTNHFPLLYYIQKRSVFTPLVMYGGFINLFAVTQLWNPYFPRSLLLTLIRTGNVMFFLGLIL